MPIEAHEQLADELFKARNDVTHSALIAGLMLDAFTGDKTTFLEKPDEGILPPCIEFDEYVEVQKTLEKNRPPVTKFFAVDTNRFPIDASVQGITSLDERVCGNMSHHLCRSCILKDFARRRRLQMKGQIDDKRTSYTITGPSEGDIIVTSDVTKSLQLEKPTREPYKGCARPIDYARKLLINLDPISTVLGTVFHKLDTRQAFNHLTAKGIQLPTSMIPSTVDILSPNSRVRKVLSRLTIADYKIATHTLPQDFDVQQDEENDREVRSIAWRNSPIIPEGNGYCMLEGRVSELGQSLEARVEKALKEVGINDFYIFAEINLRSSETADIGSFVKEYKHNILENVRQKTPRSQMAFYHAFNDAEGNSYISSATGIPDKVIFGMNNGVDRKNLMQRVANLMYGENGGRNLFDPQLYIENPQYADVLVDLGREIADGNIKLIIEETKIGNRLRIDEAAKDSAHYLLSMFCLLSAFDNTLTLDDLIKNSTFICDTRELKLKGQNLMSVLMNGADLAVDTITITSDNLRTALNIELASIIKRMRHPNKLEKIESN